MTNMIARCAVVAVAVGVLFGACTFDVDFRLDKRLQIVTPEDRSTVNLPFEIRWKVKDFEVRDNGDGRADDSGYFALFFDRAPVAAGKNLRSVAEDDESCLQTPGCPSVEYLNARNVYTSTQAVFKVDAIADERPRERPEANDWHEVTIVLVNPRGERIGESSYSVRFIVDRG